MTDHVKGGAPSGRELIEQVAPSEAGEPVKPLDSAARVEGFDAVVAGQLATDPTAHPISTDPALVEVIDDVARALMTGELADPSSAIEAVIDNIIGLRFKQVAPSIRQRMAEDLRVVLTQDPFFVLEVEELLAHALARV